MVDPAPNAPLPVVLAVPTVRLSSTDNVCSGVMGIGAEEIAWALRAWGRRVEHTSSASKSSGPGLSDREVEVLALVGAGLSNIEIGQQLYLSINTIKSYIRSAYAKIHVETRSQAVRWALAHGLADLNEM